MLMLMESVFKRQNRASQLHAAPPQPATWIQSKTFSSKNLRDIPCKDPWDESSPIVDEFGATPRYGTSVTARRNHGK